MKSSIIVAVSDPIVHPEAMNIAAATGLAIIDVGSADELRRVAGRGEAVVVDKLMASSFGSNLGHPRVLFVAADPGPIDWQWAFTVGAVAGFVIPAQAPELLRSLSRADMPRGAINLSIGVVGAVGGCGTSTFAVALARELGEGAVLVDADPTSGGLDLLVGAENTVGARWNDLRLTTGSINPEDLRAALPEDEGLAFLTCSRSAGAVHALEAQEVHAAASTLRQYPLVVDLSPRLPDWEEVAAALQLIVVLVPAEIRAVSAARPLLASLKANVVVLLRHRGWSGLTVAEVERLAGCEVLAEISQANALVKRSEMQGLSDCPRQLRVPVRAVLEVA